MKNRTNTGWMENSKTCQSALGSLSSGSPRYAVKEMSSYERKRKSLFEDFRSRMISQAELKAELDALND